MKFFLKSLYQTNKSYYVIWDYLWIMSNTKNEIVFKYTSLSNELKVSKSTITRALKLIDELNSNKIYIDITKLENTEYLVKFYPNGKVITKEESFLNKELFDYLVEYYKKNDIHYPELKRHKSFVKKIAKKLSILMVNKKVEINETNIKNTFIHFFDNIPSWWKQNQFTLPSIEKNFTKIINQIRQAKRKNIKYAETQDKIDNLKFK